MRLASMLNQPGGISEQGRRVVLRLRYTGKGSEPQVRDVAAVMLPISEVDYRSLEQLATETAAKPDAPLSAGNELVVRLLQACLRDPGDLSKRLIEDETDLRALRHGLVSPQYAKLIEEYKALIATEYPDVVTQEDADGLEREARDFSGSDQPARG